MTLRTALRPPPSHPRKTHNSSGTVDTKVALRQRALEFVPGGGVLDAYCGPIGEMYMRVWSRAARYVGIDREWRRGDARRRFVGDNLTVLRAIDLRPFSVFDLDAFGSPWEAAVIVAARRAWSPGERGALVLTDAGSMQGRYGTDPRGVRDLLGLDGKVATGEADAQARGEMALAAWVRRARVSVVERLRAVGSPSARGARGSVVMVYSALLFEGAPP